MNLHHNAEKENKHVTSSDHRTVTKKYVNINEKTEKNYVLTETIYHSGAASLLSFVAGVVDETGRRALLWNNQTERVSVYLQGNQ